MTTKLTQLSPSSNMETFDGRLQTPFACIVGGSPLAGKTTWVTRLLENRNRLIDNEFDYIVWIYGQETTFINKLRNQTFGIPTLVVRGLPDSFDEYIQKDNNKRGLIVIDDLMASVSRSDQVTELFCNKVHHDNVSVIIMMQNLFYHGKERTTLMRCAHYLVVFKNPLDGSVPLFLAQKIMPLRKKLFMDIFQAATKEPFGYLYIDGRQTTPPSARFRTDMFNDDIQIVFSVVSP